LALNAETGAIVGVHSMHSEWAFTAGLTIERRYESLIASHPASGLVAWTFGSNEPISAGPLVVGDYVYIADGEGELIVLRLQGGKVVLRRELPAKAEWQSDRARIPTAFGADGRTLAVPLLNGKIAVYPLR
jgi:outer membrane protein assembly factor BamB